MKKFLISNTKNAWVEVRKNGDNYIMMLLFNKGMHAGPFHYFENEADAIAAAKKEAKSYKYSPGRKSYKEVKRPLKRHLKTAKKSSRLK